MKMKILVTVDQLENAFKLKNAIGMKNAIKLKNANKLMNAFYLVIAFQMKWIMLKKNLEVMMCVQSRK